MAFHVNFELKAKSKNIEWIRDYLKENCTRNVGKDFQKDTYFLTRKGRLKLREGNIENSLIFYNRPDLDGPKQSDVNLVRLSPESGVRETLRKANGIKVVVNKSREIFFIDNVKFHIDEVEGLGSFIEIEAIDSDGSYGLEKLQKQCDEYIGIFKIQNDDFLNNSYSDMILELGRNFRHELEKEFESFTSVVHKELSEKKVNVASNPDHACFRVKTMEEYSTFKTRFQLIGDLLIESMVGGRMISTFRLHSPLIGKHYETDILELPQPKVGTDYETGFEHLEFVIDSSFESFSNTHPDVEFDWKGTHKDFNPELRMQLGKYSVKFHHQTLEKVIEIEKATE